MQDKTRLCQWDFCEFCEAETEKKTNKQTKNEIFYMMEENYTLCICRNSLQPRGFWVQEMAAKATLMMG